MLFGTGAGFSRIVLRRAGLQRRRLFNESYLASPRSVHGALVCVIRRPRERDFLFQRGDVSPSPAFSAQWILRRYYKPLIRAPSAGTGGCCGLWLVDLRRFVGIQMGLGTGGPFHRRPEIGGQLFFREDSWGNAYVYICGFNFGTCWRPSAIRSVAPDSVCMMNGGRLAGFFFFHFPARPGVS